MRFFNQNLPALVLSSHTCYKSNTSHPPLFYHPIGLDEECKLWCSSLYNFFLPSCYFFCLQFRHFPQRVIQYLFLETEFHTHMKNAHTLSADIHESEPWAALNDLSLPNRARTLPGASLRACSESVGPRSSRHFATPLSASSSIAITGPEVMYSIRKLKQVVGVPKLQIQEIFLIQRKIQHTVLCEEKH